MRLNPVFRKASRSSRFHQAFTLIELLLVLVILGILAVILLGLTLFWGFPLELSRVLAFLVTLLREGQPVRMSKRRGEFVLMDELIEEVGRDAARFTFLTRRHDSPLEFDLAVATRQSSDNPVFYVQYAHARIASVFRNAAAGLGPGIADDERLRSADLAVLDDPLEIEIMRRIADYPRLVEAAGPGTRRGCVVRL